MTSTWKAHSVLPGFGLTMGFTLAYLSLIDGVKGLFFYTGFGQRDYLGRPAGLLNKPEEGHWEYVKQLVGELMDEHRCGIGGRERLEDRDTAWL